MSYLSIDKKRLIWLIPLLVSVFTFVVFLPALKNEFLGWDDIYNLVDNQKYRGLGYEQLKWMFTSKSCYMGPYVPVTWLTYALDYVIWGIKPFGYHLTNVVLHSINALVFYFLCVKLLALASPPSLPEKEGELNISAGFAALFFAVHPFRVESASWLSGRHDILSCFFYMLAILLYISPRAPDGENAPFWRRHILPLAAFFLALLSKGMAISLPVVLIVLDIYPLGRLPGDPRKWFSPEVMKIWLEKVPFFALAAVFGVIGYISQSNIGALSSYQEFGFVQRAAQILFAVFFYIRKTLIPLDLSPLYRLPAGFGLLNWQSLVAGSIIAAITATAIALRRRWPAGLAVWAYYLVTLSPVVGIVKINTQATADRYTYLSCLGFAVLAGAGFRASRQTAGKQLRNIYAILACLIISGLALLTWRQEAIWRNTETLWKHALAISPELDLAWYNLGSLMAAQGKNDEAVKYYQEALRVKPNYADAHYNLGIVLAAQGINDEAVKHYLEALRFIPDFAQALYNLGLTLAAQGKTNEAVKHYLEALRIKPDYEQPHTKLGVILAAQGKTDEAVKHYLEALRINPDYAQAHNNLGLILAAQGKTDEAVKHYLEALRINPGDAHAHNNLGLILAAQDKNDEATKHYLKALRINPNSVEAHYNFSLVLAAQGKFDEAMGHYHEALRINPSIRVPAPRKQGK
ncbi:MAG: tetratricopeptide repeat protein [Elusimicrobiota bacterium]|nr:tetratricopeptide repeat protein [Elusimicrobiota bacterium]